MQHGGTRCPSGSGPCHSRVARNHGSTPSCRACSPFLPLKVAELCLPHPGQGGLPRAFGTRTSLVACPGVGHVPRVTPTCIEFSAAARARRCTAWQRRTLGAAWRRRQRRRPTTPTWQMPRPPRGRRCTWCTSTPPCAPRPGRMHVCPPSPAPPPTWCRPCCRPSPRSAPAHTCIHRYMHRGNPSISRMLMIMQMKVKTAPVTMYFLVHFHQSCHPRIRSQGSFLYNNAVICNHTGHFDCLFR